MMVGVGVSRKALVHSIKGVAPVSNAPRRHPLLMASALQAVTLGCWVVDRALVLFRTCARRQKCHHHENSKKQEHMHVGMPLKRTAVLGVLIKRGGGGVQQGFNAELKPMKRSAKVRSMMGGCRRWFKVLVVWYYRSVVMINSENSSIEITEQGAQYVNGRIPPPTTNRRPADTLNVHSAIGMPRVRPPSLPPPELLGFVRPSCFA